jgi:hypothetical protein
MEPWTWASDPQPPVLRQVFRQASLLLIRDHLPTQRLRQQVLRFATRSNAIPLKAQQDNGAAQVHSQAMNKTLGMNNYYYYMMSFSFFFTWSSMFLIVHIFIEHAGEHEQTNTCATCVCLMINAL